jgi:hypothetical protein
VARAVSKPLTVNMGFGIRQRSTTPLLSAARLQALGVAVVIYPRLLTAAAIQGMNNAIAAFQQMLATGEVVDRPDLLVRGPERARRVLRVAAPRAALCRQMSQARRGVPHQAISRSSSQTLSGIGSPAKVSLVGGRSGSKPSVSSTITSWRTC